MHSPRAARKPPFAAFLRAVNLGGATTLRMEELRAALGGLGFGPAETALQSGNAIFQTDERDPTILEGRIERTLGTRGTVRNWTTALKVRGHLTGP